MPRLSEPMTRSRRRPRAARAMCTTSQHASDAKRSQRRDQQRQRGQPVALRIRQLVGLEQPACALEQFDDEQRQPGEREHEHRPSSQCARRRSSRVRSCRSARSAASGAARRSALPESLTRRSCSVRPPRAPVPVRRVRDAGRPGGLRGPGAGRSCRAPGRSARSQRTTTLADDVVLSPSRWAAWLRPVIAPAIAAASASTIAISVLHSVAEA